MKTHLANFQNIALEGFHTLRLLMSFLYIYNRQHHKLKESGRLLTRQNEKSRSLPPPPYCSDFLFPVQNLHLHKTTVPLLFSRKQ